MLPVYYSTVLHLKAKLQNSVTLTKPFLLAGFPIDPRTGETIEFAYDTGREVMIYARALSHC